MVNVLINHPAVGPPMNPSIAINKAVKKREGRAEGNERTLGPGELLSLYVLVDGIQIFGDQPSCKRAKEHPSAAEKVARHEARVRRKE